MPSWSPDGKSVYFIRTTDGVGHWPAGNVAPRLPDDDPERHAGQGRRQRRSRSGSSTAGSPIDGRTWHAWIREPVVSPDGKTLAMVSDGPNPTQSDVVLQFYDLDSKKSTVPKLGETPPLGHQDPTWRPDGKVLLYVRNGRDGAQGRAGHLPLGRRQEEGRRR